MVRKSIIFDSNIWIGYFDTTNTTHKQAVDAVKKEAEQNITITEYVLLEVSTVLKQRIGPVRTNQIISTLIQTENITLLPSTDYFTSTLQTFLASDEPHLSFVDWSLVVLSDDFEVMTFDKKLADQLKKQSLLACSRS
jgi:predicted nucleic acid-binding protein